MILKKMRMRTMMMMMLWLLVVDMAVRQNVWEGAIAIRESMIVMRMMLIVMQKRKRLQSQSRRSRERSHREEEVQGQREDLQRRERVNLQVGMIMLNQKDVLDQNERNQKDVIRVMMMIAIDSSMIIYIIVDFV